MDQVENRKVFVGNLAFEATEGDLRTAFAAAGDVVDVQIVEDFMSGRSKGFAFVEMSTGAEAERAIRELDGVEIAGRRVFVKPAIRKGTGDAHGGRRSSGYRGLGGE